MYIDIKTWLQFIEFMIGLSAVQQNPLWPSKLGCVSRGLEDSIQTLSHCRLHQPHEFHGRNGMHLTKWSTFVQLLGVCIISLNVPKTTIIICANRLAAACRCLYWKFPSILHHFIPPEPLVFWLIRKSGLLIISLESPPGSQLWKEQSLLRLWSSTSGHSCCGNIWSQGPSSLVEVKKWGFIFLQRPFIYLSRTPNFLPSLSGAISVAIGSPHQLLSPVRTHKDAPSVGTERVPTARLLSLLSFVRAALVPHPPVTAETSRIHQRQQAPPSRRRRHNLDSMAGFISHAAKHHLSLSVKDFLTRPNLRTSSAGGGVIFSRSTLSTCSSCISSCALDSFSAPVGPVAVNWMYVLTKSGQRKSEELGSAWF